MLRQLVRAAVAAMVVGAPVLTATQAAACPDWQGQPYFGQIELYAGFQPDPYVRNITAGGTQRLENCGFNATGFVTSRPDFDLYWRGQSAQLTIAVEANADAVLLVNAPDGSWFYSDDYRGTNRRSRSRTRRKGCMTSGSAPMTGRGATRGGWSLRSTTTDRDAQGRMAENVVHFARALRAGGLPVGTDRAMAAVEAVAAAGLLTGPISCRLAGLPDFAARAQDRL